MGKSEETEQLELVADERGPAGVSVGASWSERKRKLPSNFRWRRKPPENHNGHVVPGDLVTFVPPAQPRQVIGEQKGQPKEMPNGWPDELEAIVARVVKAEKGIVDLRVRRVYEGEERVFDEPGVPYDRTGKQRRSWH